MAEPSQAARLVGRLEEREPRTLGALGLVGKGFVLRADLRGWRGDLRRGAHVAGLLLEPQQVLDLLPQGRIAPAGLGKVSLLLGMATLGQGFLDDLALAHGWDPHRVTRAI